MPTSTNAVASSLAALTEQYRQITENLANADTAGFKRREMSFQQALAGVTAGATEEAGPATGQITPTSAIDFTQGGLTATGRVLDLALEGSGFFTLQSPEGEMYTRCGKFRTNDQRQLVDPAGMLVAGSGGPIVVPTGVSTMDIAVSRDGTVSAAGVSIGKLKISDFEDPSKLISKGAGRFGAPEGVEPTDAEQYVVRQGFYESSNVSVVEELVGLITVTRLYEANLKSISAQDEQMKSILDVAMS